MSESADVVAQAYNAAMNAELPRIRVLVAEDNPDVRAAICALVASEPDMELVGEASAVHEIRGAARHSDAHVVVLDLNLHGESSVESVRALQLERPWTGVVVFSGYDAEYVAAGLRALEPCVFVSKSGEVTELFAAIRSLGNRAADAGN